jgi:hypothetical protein
MDNHLAWLLHKAELPKSLELTCKVEYRGRSVDVGGKDAFGATNVDWSSVILHLYVEGQRNPVYSSRAGSCIRNWDAAMGSFVESFLSGKEFTKVERRLHQELFELYLEENRKPSAPKTYELRKKPGAHGEFTYVLVFK